VNEAITFRTAWLEHYHDAVFAQTLPQCINDQLPLESRWDFLENVSDDDQIKLAFIPHRYHSQGIDPQYGISKLIFR